MRPRALEQQLPGMEASGAAGDVQYDARYRVAVQAQGVSHPSHQTAVEGAPRPARGASPSRQRTDIHVDDGPVQPAAPVAQPIYPAKPQREEPNKAARRATSAAFCGDVPDPRFARQENLQSQITLGSEANGAAGAAAAATLRVPTAEELRQPRRRVASRSRSSKGRKGGGSSASVRSARSAGSTRTMSTAAPSSVSTATTASTVLRARLAQLEMENAALREVTRAQAAPGSAEPAPAPPALSPPPPQAGGLMKQGKLYHSEKGFLAHDGQSSPPRLRTSHQDSVLPPAPQATTAPDYEAQIQATLDGIEARLRAQHLSSSIKLSHPEGGDGEGAGADAGQGSPSRHLERRSPTRSRLPTPPHRRPASPNAAGADAGSAGLVSELDNTREGQEREPGTRGGERRALDNSSQWTVGIAEPGGAAAPPEPMVSLQQPQPRPKLSLH